MFDLVQRYTNYTTEELAIRKKLHDKRVSQEKRARLKFRLTDIKKRLIPETLKQISTQTGGITSSLGEIIERS